MMEFDTLSDTELVALIKEGNADAFKEVYNRYNQLLYIFAYRKLKQREESKDVVQDVFAWLWNHRESISAQATLAAYLYKSVLNNIYDIFRHQNIVQKWIEQGNYYIDVADEQTDYLIREKDIQQIIQREIDAMPPRMREIYDLKRQQYMTVKEIADELDLSEHTVATQLKRAQKHLKLKLGVFIYIVFLLHL